MQVSRYGCFEENEVPLSLMPSIKRLYNDTHMHTHTFFIYIYEKKLMREKDITLKILSSCRGTETPLPLHDTIIYSAVFQQLIPQYKKKCHSKKERCFCTQPIQICP